MKSINLTKAYSFVERNADSFITVGRNVQILYEAIKAGTKANPVLLYVNTAISVVDATIAYLRYRAEKEKTERLMIQVEATKKTICKSQRRI